MLIEYAKDPISEHFERNYDVLKSKSLWIMLNKSINFNKNETESKNDKSHTQF